MHTLTLLNKHTITSAHATSPPAGPYTAGCENCRKCILLDCNDIATSLEDCTTRMSYRTSCAGVEVSCEGMIIVYSGTSQKETLTRCHMFRGHILRIRCPLWRRPEPYRGCNSIPCTCPPLELQRHIAIKCSPSQQIYI